MNGNFQSIFGTKKGVLIGAIHFPPLLGYPGFPGFDSALKNALADLSAFTKGGVDALIVENNYDLPHKAQVGPETVASLAYLASKLKEKTKLPMGISVLWNDYKAAFAIAKAVGLDFIRIPVFVDDVKTEYGTMRADPQEVIRYRNSIGAERIGLFADIHVKHSEMLSKHPIEESARLAMAHGADAVIVTGRWTGDAPQMEKIRKVRAAAGDFPILCGSGIDETNVRALFSIADGAIVSTSLKEGSADPKETNIKPYEARINAKKVAALAKAK